MNLLQRIWGRQKKRTLSGFEVNLRFSTYRTILRTSLISNLNIGGLPDLIPVPDRLGVHF